MAVAISVELPAETVAAMAAMRATVENCIINERQVVGVVLKKENKIFISFTRDPGSNIYH